MEAPSVSGWSAGAHNEPQQVPAIIAAVAWVIAAAAVQGVGLALLIYLIAKGGRAKDIRPLLKPIVRKTDRPFMHYRTPLVVTLLSGPSRD